MYKFYSDGGSRGNPGHSAFAIVVVKDGKVIHEYSEFLGVHTNNYAEYRGLIANLTYAVKNGIKEAEFIMDSQLVIMQMRGQYKVKSESVMELYQDAKTLASFIPKITFTHVRRSEQYIPRADALLNAEMDRHEND
ncbi:MAG: ribonuclease HI family protein [archaeon]|nr:ribonuclease HI family protein [archaeon]